MRSTDFILALAVPVAGLLSVAACGDNAETATGAGGSAATGPGAASGTGTGSGTTTVSGTTGPGGGGTESFTATFGPVEVAPGQENTQCVTKRLTNAEAKKIGQIHNILDGGSHHLIVYRVADTVEILEPYDCQPFSDTLDPEKGSPLMVTQKHDETLVLPQGVAFSIEATQMVRLEMHFLNTTAAPVMVGATSVFTTIPAAEFMHEAGFLFIGNPDIDIAPQSQFTLGPTFLPMPDNLVGSKFFGITGHTHQWGTNVTVAISPSEAGADTPVYDVENWLWSEPETVYQDPPFEIPAGGGFRFTCSYDNQSNQQVGFGESAQDEMCFFWAYYYPNKGSFVCAHTDQVPGGYDICCPGNPNCGQLF